MHVKGGLYTENNTVNSEKNVLTKTTFNVIVVVVIFAGGILANLMLGEPVLAPLKANNQLLLSTVVW